MINEKMIEAAIIGYDENATGTHEFAFKKALEAAEQERWIDIAEAPLVRPCLVLTDGGEAHVATKYTNLGGWYTYDGGGECAIYGTPTRFQHLLTMEKVDIAIKEKDND